MQHEGFNVRRARTCVHISTYGHMGKERDNVYAYRTEEVGERENKLDTRLRERIHVRHGQARSEREKDYTRHTKHAKRARKVQRGSKRGETLSRRGSRMGREI